MASRASARLGRGGATVIALAGALAISERAGAQDWQMLEARRPARDTQPVHVALAYGVGTLRLEPADSGTLYDVRLRYDADRLVPTVDWQAGARTLRVRTRLDGLRLPASGRTDLTLGLTARAPLDLDVQLGAVEAELDLTGLRVRSLDFASGASRATVRFDTAARQPLERLSLQVGAGTLRVLGLAQAQARRIDASGGVGEIVLDFAGSWTGDVEVDLALAIGQARLVVPPDVGVRVEAEARWLNRLDLPGFERDGDAWVSPGYASARRTMRVALTSVLGTLAIERR